MKGAFFSLNLLEAQTVFRLVKVIYAWPLPLLVAFRIVLLEALDVLRQFLKHLFLKLTLWLARVNASSRVLPRSPEILVEGAI